MPKIEGVDQNTPEWLVMRIGCFTSSRAPDLMAVYLRDFKRDGVQYKAGEPRAERRNYVRDVAIERLTGESQNHVNPKAPQIEHGNEMQEQAAGDYALHMEVSVTPGGLWAHDSIDWFMASPDYLIGDTGILETKCPTTMQHLDYILNGGLVEEYWWQCQAQMACCPGRTYADIMSYDDRVPEKWQKYIRRIERDNAEIARLEREVEKAKLEVAAYLASLEKEDGHQIVLEPWKDSLVMVGMEAKCQ